MKVEIGQIVDANTRDYFNGLREALWTIALWEFDIMGDCVAEARKISYEALDGRIDLSSGINLRTRGELQDELYAEKEKVRLLNIACIDLQESVDILTDERDAEWEKVRVMKEALERIFELAKSWEKRIFTADGSVTYFCSVCGESAEIASDALGHTEPEKQNK